MQWCFFVLNKKPKHNFLWQLQTLYGILNLWKMYGFYIKIPLWKTTLKN